MGSKFVTFLFASLYDIEKTRPQLSREVNFVVLSNVSLSLTEKMFLL